MAKTPPTWGSRETEPELDRGHGNISHSPFFILSQAGTQTTLSPMRRNATQPPGEQWGKPQHSQTSTCVAEGSTSTSSTALNRRMPTALTAVAVRRPWPDDEKSSPTAQHSMSMASTLHMASSALFTRLDAHAAQSGYQIIRPSQTHWSPSIFLVTDDPRRAKFERLTRQEERAGLLAETASIGTGSGWAKERAGIAARDRSPSRTRSDGRCSRRSAPGTCRGPNSNILTCDRKICRDPSMLVCPNE